MSQNEINSDSAIPTPKNWIQTLLPSAEELNLDVTIAKEKADSLKRQNAPPKGQKTGWVKFKSKKMHIISRNSNVKHLPYWNVRESIELGKMDQSCFDFYISYINKVHSMSITGLGVDFMACFVDMSIHQCSNNCVVHVMYYMRRLLKTHYVFSPLNFVGAKDVDFRADVVFKPSTASSITIDRCREPKLYQVRTRNWNVRRGQALSIKLNDYKHDALFVYAFKVAQYGSYEEAYKQIQTDTHALSYDGVKYDIMAKRSSDIGFITDPRGVAFLNALCHGGINNRDIPSIRSMYDRLYCNVTMNYAKAIQLKCYNAWSNRSKNNNWSKRPGLNYTDLLMEPLLRLPFQFLRTVINIYKSLCDSIMLQKRDTIISCSVLLSFASFYWNIPNTDYCEHGNFPINTFKCLKPCSHEFPHIGRTVGSNDICSCLNPIRPTVIHRAFPVNRPNSPNHVVRLDAIPTSDVPKEEVNEEKMGFFEYIKSCLSPGAVESTYPEEGDGVSGSLQPVESWITKAIDYFFHSFKDFISTSLSNFKGYLGDMWDSIKNTIKIPFTAIGTMLDKLSSPVISLLRKFIEAMGLGWFITNRNLTSDFYSVLIGIFVFHAVQNPLIKLLIVLYFCSHFNLITNVQAFIKYLRDSFYSQAPEIEAEVVDDEEAQPTSMFVTFLTYLSTTNFTSLLIKASTAIVFTVAGVAATMSNKASLSKIFIDIFKNMGYIGQGINGMGNLWKTLSSGIPKILKWIRSKVGYKSQADKDEEELDELKKKYRKKVFDFMTIVELWNNDHGYATLKRSRQSQSYIVEMRPTVIFLARASYSPLFEDVFTRDILQSFRPALKAYNKLFDIVYRVCSYGNFRQTPFHIQFVGLPGVGKSTLLQKVATDIKNRYLPDVSQNALIFSRGNTDHFDGYCNQPIMIQDDMWSTDDYKTVSEILPLISNAPIVVPMAQLSDKATFFDSKFILSTTNTPFPTTTAVRCNEAIWRRRNIFCRVTIMDAVYNSSTCKFDLEKFKRNFPNMSDDERNATLPHLRFDILSPIPSGGGEEPMVGIKNIAEFPSDQIPFGLQEPLTNLTYMQFIGNVFNRYDVLVDEEASIRQPNDVVLGSVRDIYNLVNDLVDETQDPTILGPIASTFLDFDFSDKVEAEEPTTTHAEEEVGSVLNVEPFEELSGEIQPSWYDLPDDWNPQYPENNEVKTPPPPKPKDDDWDPMEVFKAEPTSDTEKPGPSNEAVIDEGWEKCLNMPDKLWYAKYKASQKDVNFYVNTQQKNIARAFMEEYKLYIPKDVKRQMQTFCDNGDGHEDQHYGAWIHADNKRKSGVRLSRAEEKTWKAFRHLYDINYIKPLETEKFIPNFRNPLYVPFAGEMPMLDSEYMYNDARGPFHPVMIEKGEKRYYAKAVPTTTDTPEGKAVLLDENYIYPEMARHLDNELGKPFGGQNITQRNKVSQWLSGKFSWEESVRSNGIFNPVLFNPDVIKIDATQPGLRETFDMVKNDLARLPADFIAKVRFAPFHYKYLTVDEDLIKKPIQFDNLPVKTHYVEINRYCLLETTDGKMGAMTKHQWDEMQFHLQHVIRKSLSYNDRNAFDRACESQYHLRVRTERSYAKFVPSPYYITEKVIYYMRIFNNLPDNIKQLIVEHNMLHGPQKLKDIKIMQQNYRSIMKYAFIKYNALINPRPSPWLVGVGDIMTTAVVGAFAGIVFYAVRQMLCAFFGVEPKPTSRVLFKRSLPRHLAPRPTSLQESEDMHNQILKNLVYIYHPLAGYSNGFGIDGQNIMVNLHWIRPMYEKGESFVMTFLPTNNSIGDKMWEATVRITDIRIVPNSDVAFIHSKSFRFFSKIIHRFITETDLHTYELPPQICQSYYDKDVKIAMRTGLTTRTIDSMTVNFLNNTITNMVEYNAPMISGMSGSPVYATYPFSNGRMMFGIQSCANAKGSSWASIVTQEMIREYLPSQIVHEGPILSDPILKDDASPIATSLLINEHLNIDGCIPIYKVSGICGKTCFNETIFSEQFPSDRIPAVINAYDVRVPADTHPLQHSVNKFGRNVIKEMPVEILDRSIEDVTRFIRSKLGNTELKVLSLEEAILGLPLEGHEKINIKTSPGLPWLWNKVLPGKKTWIQIDEQGEIDLLSDEVKLAFDQYDAKLQQGIIPANSFYEFPKDELRPIEKALGPPMKTRSISVMDFILSLLYRKYNLDLEAKLHQLADGTFPSCVGINPHSRAWHRMYRELSSRDSVGNDFDISNWDGHFPGWLFDAVAQVFNNLYDDDNAIPRTALFLNACFGYTNFLNLVLQKNRGMPSGFAGTAIVNTIGHFILFYCFYIIQCNQCNIRINLNDFVQHVSSFFYGDDVIFSITPQLKDLGITPKGFIDLYTNFGWPITSASKTGDAAIERPISELTFLKRYFQLDPLFGNAVVYGRIEKSVIYDLLHWQRKTPNPQQQLLVNINEAMEFAFSHGHNFYSKLQRQIFKVCSINGISLIIPSYSEMRSIMLDRYLH